jgi:predicted nucleic acid-binding protein
MIQIPAQLVIDCSVAAAWLLPDEQSVTASRILMAAPNSSFVVPVLFKLELANVMCSAMRRKRVDASLLSQLAREVQCLPMRFEPLGLSFDALLAGAMQYALTPYDYIYLEMSKRLNLPLATLDAKLAIAAKGAGVIVLTD